MQRYFTLAAVLALSVGSAIGAAVAAEPALVNILELPGTSVDLTKVSKQKPGGANVNRNGFFSDLFYDSKNNEWYALSDRGPGGGLIAYSPRVQNFTITYDKDTGKISNYQITKTIIFKNEDGSPFNGLNPLDLNDDPSILGDSFDPEGIVVGQGGHLFVSDEYGPSIYEFSASGGFVRAFTPPDNLLPRVGGNLNFAADPPQTGRQGNRGYEGLAINKSRTKLYAILQDPLQEEGTGTTNPGRRSRNVRIVEYNIVTGQSERQ